MAKKSKRLRQAFDLVQIDKKYALQDALDLLSKYAEAFKAKFDETVEIVFKLGVDPKHSDQMIRGAVVMPSGMGREVKVAVFLKQERFNEARAAGADIYGESELIEEVKSGTINFDICISTPDMMPKVGVLGKVLGPKGLMPNVKLGTVSDDIKEAVQRVKSGQVEYKVEKAGLVHAGVGKLSFDSSALKSNIMALYGALLNANPASSKGVYMRKIFLSTSQGFAIQLDLKSMMN